MSDATKAVFLSYAREDTDAAKRIAEALRGFGVEVWFDQEELHGGDAWDAKIRRQIRECALFVPLVSQQTEERAEGYFRREWKIAIDRTQDMGSSRAFIVPVVIDGTKETGADVPEEFMRYQWTRLANGEPTPDFVALVKRLLETPKKPALKGELPRPPTSPPLFKHAAPKTEDRGQRTEDSRAGRKPAVPGWPKSALWLAILLGAFLGVAIYWATRAPAPGPDTLPKSEPVAKAVPAADESAPADKSIAVLPFANMSSDKENEFFTDGIHEDILTNLALIRDVRVISRTSVMQYRGTTKPISQIAQELKVAYVLEGSVRRSGNKVKVTGQLIRAANDEHLWAKSYDRDLTDVFTIQGEIATAIAGALQSMLSPEAKSILDRRPTDNPAAYDLYLKARHLRHNGSITEQHGIIPLLEQAVQLDPQFAAAWSELGSRRVFVYFNMEHTEALLAKAREAIETAVRLAPDDPAVIEGQGDYYYYGYRDYARATENYTRLAQLRPNDPVLFWSMALIQRRQGQFADALQNFQRAIELDPSNIGYSGTMYELLVFGRRYAEAEALARKAGQAWPDHLRTAWMLPVATYCARGSTVEMMEFARRTVPATQRAEHLYYQRVNALMRGDWAEIMRLDGLQRHFKSEDDPTWAQDVTIASVLAEMGNLPAARVRAREALAAMKTEVVQQPTNDVLWASLAVAHALLGDKAESMRCREKSLELMPPARDAIQSATNAVSLAGALAWCGEKERALAEFERLLQRPWGTNIYRERGCWLGSWKPLRDDPRFLKLLNDPKNNAPLF